MSRIYSLFSLPCHHQSPDQHHLPPGDSLFSGIPDPSLFSAWQLETSDPKTNLIVLLPCLKFSELLSACGMKSQSTPEPELSPYLHLTHPCSSLLPLCTSPLLLPVSQTPHLRDSYLTLFPPNQLLATFPVSI